MSPMIDLVFLLLIFFMVTSRLIIIQQDPAVEIPVAQNAQDLTSGEGRVVVNILKEGMYRNEFGTVMSEEELEVYFRDQKKLNDGNNVTTRLHVRGDRRALVKEMKKVVARAAEAGIIEVVFATYQMDRYTP
ncbi:MAG: biopolymer transporter ExbD [Pseudomonadota bacterium]